MLKSFAVASTLFIACVSGCGSDGDPSAAEPKTGSTPTDTATTSSVSTGANISILCYSKKYDSDVSGLPNDMRSLWAAEYDDCSDTTAAGEPSPHELKALTTAYPDDEPDLESLASLFATCVENDKQWGSYIKEAGSPEQLTEMRGALLLCPDHPQRAKVEKYMTGAENGNKLQAEGRIFYDGTYRVGKQIQPGTYFAKPDGEQCYWERTDSSGNIIDNNISGGLRAEMTVQASDYSVTVERCGKWQPVK